MSNANKSIRENLQDITALIMRLTNIPEEYIDGGRVTLEIDFENHESTRFLYALFENEEYDLLASGLIVLASMREDLPHRIIAHFLKAMIIQSSKDINANYELTEKIKKLNEHFERVYRVARGG